MFNNEYNIKYFIQSRTLKMKETYKDWKKIAHVFLSDKIETRDGIKPEYGNRIEFAVVVRDNIDNNRIAHTINHPSNFLFIKMYELILKKWFHREIPESVFNINKKYEYLSSDGYSTKLTFYDRECLNYNINETYLNEEDSNKYILEKISKKNIF